MLYIEAKAMGKGHKREVEFHPVMASNVIKPRHSSDLPGRKRRGIQSQFYDPRPPKSRKLDVTGIVKLGSADVSLGRKDCV